MADSDEIFLKSRSSVDAVAARVADVLRLEFVGRTASTPAERRYRAGARTLAEETGRFF